MKILVLKKEKNDKSKFRVFSKSYWRDIFFDAKEIPVLLSKREMRNGKIKYTISTPVVPGFYMPKKDIKIDKKDEAEFLKVFDEAPDAYIQELEHTLDMLRDLKLDEMLKRND